MRVGQTVYLKPHFTPVEIIDTYFHLSEEYLVVKGKQETPYMRKRECFVEEVPRTVTISFKGYHQKYCYFCPPGVEFEKGELVIVGEGLLSSLKLAVVVDTNKAHSKATKMLQGFKVGDKF